MKTIFPRMKAILPCMKAIIPCMKAIFPCITAIFPCMKAITPCIKAIFPCMKAITLCMKAIIPCMKAIFPYITARKRPKFRFGVRLILAGSVRFGKNFADLFVIQFHAHLQYTGIKWTDYAILCYKSFSQSQQNSLIHISTTPFYVVKLSACCGEGFYIHALIL